MDASKFCKHCGNNLTTDAQFCSKCGVQIETDSSFPQIKKPHPSPKSHQKSPIVVLILGLFLGILGIHRVYVGKIYTGLFMLITVGGFGIWYLVDLILIVTNKFEDKNGTIIQLTQNPSSFKKVILVIGAVFAWLLLFVGTIFIIVLFLTSGLIYSINHQLSALKTGDIEKAYSYTSKDFQKATSLSDFKKFINQYPSLKNNESAFFIERTIENNMGFVKGTLTAKDGAKTPIEYRLIREDGVWKILNIKVSYTGAGIDIDHNVLKSSSSLIPQESTWIDFNNKANRYSLKYPSNWEYVKSGKGTVIFRGKKDTNSYHTIITIRTLLTKKNKGQYSTIQELKDDFKSLIFKNTTESKLLDQGKIELPQNPKRIHGEYLLFTYKYKNKEFKQMDTIILRDDGLAFYTWSYTSLMKQYNSDLPIAKRMYESWIIY
jgi:TM2 domain-containing membrane protein YozV